MQWRTDAANAVRRAGAKTPMCITWCHDRSADLTIQATSSRYATAAMLLFIQTCRQSCLGALSSGGGCGLRAGSIGPAKYRKLPETLDPHYASLVWRDSGMGSCLLSWRLWLGVLF